MIRETMSEAGRCVNTAPASTRSTSIRPKEGLAMKATQVCLMCAWKECVCHLPGGQHCNVFGCTAPRSGKYKMCSKHRARWRKHGDVTRTRETPEERAPRRFWRQVEIRGPEECWLWRGHVQSNGYGDFQVVRKHWRAHRFAYVDAVGPIPNGLTLDHLCGVTACVNPDHTWSR